MINIRNYILIRSTKLKFVHKIRPSLMLSGQRHFWTCREGRNVLRARITSRVKWRDLGVSTIPTNRIGPRAWVYLLWRNKFSGNICRPLYRTLGKRKYPSQKRNKSLYTVPEPLDKAFPFDAVWTKEGESNASINMWIMRVTMSVSLKILRNNGTKYSD